MLIVDSQIHIWQDSKMSAHHRQIPTYSKEDALAEMAAAGVDAAVLHPPSTLGEAMNALAAPAGEGRPHRLRLPGDFGLPAAIPAHVLWRRRGGPGQPGLSLSRDPPA